MENRENISERGLNFYTDLSLDAIENGKTDTKATLEHRSRVSEKSPHSDFGRGDQRIG